MVPPRWTSGKASASRVTGLGSSLAFPVNLLSRSSHTSDFNKSDTQVAWRDRVNAETVVRCQHIVTGGEIKLDLPLDCCTVSVY